MIAGADPGHRGADRLHDARALVAEDSGQRERQAAGGDAQVGVADPGGDHADQHLVRARVGQFYFAQLEARAGGLDDGC